MMQEKDKIVTISVVSKSLYTIYGALVFDPSGIRLLEVHKYSNIPFYILACLVIVLFIWTGFYPTMAWILFLMLAILYFLTPKIPYLSHAKLKRLKPVIEKLAESDANPGYEVFLTIPWSEVKHTKLQYEMTGILNLKIVLKNEEKRSLIIFDENGFYQYQELSELKTLITKFHQNENLQHKPSHS